MAVGRKCLAVLLGLALIFAISPARSQTQISEGVRAMAQIGSDAKDRPYSVTRQPPIYPHMPAGDFRVFDGEAELLKFFQSFPREIRRRGLWITRAGPADLETEEDRRRLGRLIQQARSQGMLTYVCSAADYGGRSGLVGWECLRRSPANGSAPLRCVPRDEPHQGHPWWDCTSGSLVRLPEQGR